MHCLTKLSLRQCGVALVVAWLVAASSACSAAERETLLLEDHFQGRVSPEWTTVGHGGPQKLDPAQAALGRDPGGRHFLEIHSGLSIGKNASHWKDYRLTLSFRLPEPAADGNQLLRIIVRGPAANIWGGYNIYLYNVGGKFKIQANVWPTNPSVITPVAVDLRWHELSVSVLGQELQAQLDGRGDAKVATTDIYDASTAGGIYLGFSPGKWQLADVRVVALRPILEATDLLAQYCRLAYHPSLGKLAVKADFGECSEQPWVRRVTAVRFTVQPAGKDDALAKAEILLDAKKAGAAEVSLPKLPEGRYELKLTAFGASLEATKQFVRRTFPWERNSLGITDQVYPPFEPLAVSGNEVRSGRTPLLDERTGAVGPGAVTRPRSVGRPDHAAMRDGQRPGAVEIAWRPFPSDRRQRCSLRGLGRVAGRVGPDDLDHRVRRLHEGGDGFDARCRRPGRSAAMAGGAAGRQGSAALLSATQRLPGELRGADAAGRKDRLAAASHGVDELSRQNLEGRSRP